MLTGGFGHKGFAGKAGAPQHQAVHISATRGRDCRESRTHAQAGEADFAHARASAQLVDRKPDVFEPGLDTLGVAFGAGRVARAVKIETKHGKARFGQTLGQVPESAVRADRVVPDRVAEHDADPARGFWVGRMVPTQKSAIGWPEVNRPTFELHVRAFTHGSLFGENAARADRHLKLAHGYFELAFDHCLSGTGFRGLLFNFADFFFFGFVFFGHGVPLFNGSVCGPAAKGHLRFQTG